MINDNPEGNDYSGDYDYASTPKPKTPPTSIED